MPCLRCGKAPTIRAHLIPQAFAREVRGDLFDHAFFVGDHLLRTKNGVADGSILCGDCDSRLGHNEGYAHGVLKEIRKLTAPHHETSRIIGPLDTDRFLRFCAGILWKFSITSKSELRIKLGKYSDELRDVAYSRNQIPKYLDAVLIRMAAKCRENGSRDDVWFYRTPHPTRIDGLNLFSFSVAQFQVHVKIDRRPVPDGDFGSWIKGKEKIDLCIFPMHKMPDGRKFLRSELDNPELRKFLSGKRARAEEIRLRQPK
jgi:hypothetical protein